MGFPRSRSASKQKQGTYVRHADLINDSPERSVEDGIRNIQRHHPEVSNSDVLAVKHAIYFEDSHIMAQDAMKAKDAAERAKAQKPQAAKSKAEVKS